jgi:hypothetical protein
VLLPDTVPSCAFAELCNTCVDKKAILPSLEAFEMGIQIPSVNFVFYDFFFKSAAGDARWKDACWEAKSMEDRLGSVQAEAFAMLNLKNNYFAWLFEAKHNLKNLLVTDYDADPTRRSGKKHFSEAYLDSLEIDLDKEDDPSAEDEDDNDGLEERVTNRIVPEGGPGYDDLKKATEAAIKKTRQDAKKNTKYRDIKKQLEQLAKEEEAEEREATTAETPMMESEKKDMERRKLKKKRKLLKSFREYTVRQGDETKFKGWSKRAADDMTAICIKLKAEKEATKRFCAAYRQVIDSRSGGKRKADDVEETVVDYSELWDIGVIAEI